MDTRHIGSLEVSVIGLGTNNFGFFMEEGAVPPVVDAAIEAGITSSTQPTPTSRARPGWPGPSVDDATRS